MEKGGILKRQFKVEISCSNGLRKRVLSVEGEGAAGLSMESRGDVEGELLEIGVGEVTMGFGLDGERPFGKALHWVEVGDVMAGKGSIEDEFTIFRFTIYDLLRVKGGIVDAGLTDKGGGGCAQG